MPLYEWTCVCGQETETIENVNTETITCTHCGEAMRKGISLSTFKINGYSESNGYSNNTKES